MATGVWAARVEASEVPMLWVAAGAVCAYVLDLVGAWDALGVAAAYRWVSATIDVLFLADLLVKLAVLRGPYLRGPWVWVDVVCALPAVGALGVAAAGMESLRFVRLFRLLRVLRALRVLRSLRILRVLKHAGETREQVVYQRVLKLAVLVYAGLFIALLGADVGPKDPADAKELWLVLGSLIGMGLVLVVTRFQIPAMWSQQVRELLNVALPGPVAEHFLRHPEAYDQSARMPATVIFCDIKGFTSTVERIPLEQVKAHLEAALDAVVEAHLAQGLLIDKFIGDAVMSFRGGPLVDGTPEDHAYRVVRGALDGAKALAALGDPYFSEIKVGGASADDVLIGTFGTSRRLSYTVLGDRVNLAARLEGSCNALGVSNLFCDQTRRRVGDRPDVVWRRVGQLRVAGKEAVTVVWEAFDGSADLGWLDAYHRALDRFDGDRLDAALPLFREVLAQRPGDGPAAAYAERCALGQTAGSKVLETKK